MDGGLCFHCIYQFDYLSLKENRGLKVCLFSKLFFFKMVNVDLLWYVVGHIMVIKE